MDANRKKQLMETYKNRRPKMGVVAYKCLATQESFLETAKDTAAVFNSVSFQLSINSHPNRRLQALWNQYGDAGFERRVVQTLKYENPAEDHTDALKKMRDRLLEQDDKAYKMWQ